MQRMLYSIRHIAILRNTGEFPAYAPEHPLFPARTRRLMSLKSQEKQDRRAPGVEGIGDAWGVCVKLRMESNLGKAALHAPSTESAEVSRTWSRSGD